MIRKLASLLFGGRARRRAKLLATPFPEKWRPIVRSAVPHLHLLTSVQRQKLENDIRIFLAEKMFVAGGDISITETMRVTIAAGACMLIVALPQLDVFPKLREIIIYPHNFTEEIEAIGPDGRPYAIHRTRSGEAWHRGPVVLAWNTVAQGVASPHDGYNVVIHEFAHVLDMQEGAADGQPPLDTREAREKWVRVFYPAFDKFVDDQRRGRYTLVDPYGATNPAEFFAVASEHFFEQATLLQRFHPDLYDLLRDFYQQDPIQWGGDPRRIPRGIY
ncbi:MAG: zinc-dependent peptidase [Phycisphaerales bacterium]|nr:zinc-dependent peptidase [Phycisphaerales bacterium]MCB9864160.1 zinc-dependent peptidase [Phycisphaerales bacterium]